MSRNNKFSEPRLTLLNGVVYFAYAGYADTDPYHGWILGYDASNLNLVKVFNDTPSNSVNEDSHEGEGGIWQGGAGLASDGTHLYLMTGNGDFDASVGDYGDSILRAHAGQQHAKRPEPNKNGYGLSVVNNTTDTSRRTTSKRSPITILTWVRAARCCCPTNRAAPA